MTSPAPPSQRAELLTQELESAMAKLRKSAAAEQNHRLSEVEAAALLQHIAALTQRVEAITAAVRADAAFCEANGGCCFERSLAALSQEPRNG